MSDQFLIKPIEPTSPVQFLKLWTSVYLSLWKKPLLVATRQWLLLARINKRLPGLRPGVITKVKNAFSSMV